jgi:FkbM family methyltransferase
MNAIRSLEVDVGGQRYLITSDDSYLDQMRAGFEPAMVQLLRTVAAGSETILDIGSNIGLTAIVFSQLARKVYAFEPSARTFAFLETNLRQSGINNVLPIQIGLGSDVGEFELTVAPANRSGGYVSNLTRAGSGYETEKIAIRPLDDVVRLLNVRDISFVKIDVEGFEGQVLKGASQTLREQRPAVVLELNHWCLNAFQRTSVPDFLDQLRATFPVLFAVDGGEYLDLHDDDERYQVMYHHIIQLRFMNVVAAFDVERLSAFRASYRHGFGA